MSEEPRRQRGDDGYPRLWGGDLPPELDFGRESIRARFQALRLTLVHGRSDELITPKIVAQTRERLRTHAIAFDELAFDGGHQLDEAVLRRLLA